MISSVPSDGDLKRLLSETESSVVERKSFSDSKGWIRTVTAFANSCAFDQCGILFIGATDCGDVQVTTPPTNLDALQKSLPNILSTIYPAISDLQFRPVSKNEQTCLAVIVPGSRSRPHFSGPAYIRQGQSTVKANQECFSELIAQHSSKASAILEWKGKRITAENRNVENVAVAGPVLGYFEPVVDTCDSHCVKLRVSDSIQTISLERVKISYDGGRGRLKLEIYPF